MSDIADGRNGKDDAAPTPLALTLERLTAEDAVVDRFVYLVGRPPLNDFTQFVIDQSVDRRRTDEPALVEEWRAAHHHIRELQRTEAGRADSPRMEPLPSHLEPLRAQLLDDPLFRRAFRTVPTDVAIVELDRLVVFQKFVNLSYQEQFQRRLGGEPTDVDVFRACLPFDHPLPPVRWVRTHNNEFVFVSPSNDLRFLESVVLQPAQIVDDVRPGAVSGVIALTVGFGSNFLNAIHFENRLVLYNGTHRAYCLRAAGYTHVPCIVQHVLTRDELDAVTSGDLRRNPDMYFQLARPSMFCDYFDPKLHRIVRVRRRLRQVRIKFDVDQSDVPAL